eukprot:CAMPEP_0184658078 /NCGR_PEP_ID=MMETSP0308-20130426/23368_1 /TAXON_ID=38269 /ORGANISM="Gloeochaete witrockiana, Strain SAG 46.84" /LENGTH=703 /DNA_ID=CAMNT_0027096675 /DNA_START=169 /DNA_END=2281 /DNA_ORIENTATION=+
MATSTCKTLLSKILSAYLLLSLQKEPRTNKGAKSNATPLATPVRNGRLVATVPRKAQRSQKSSVVSPEDHQESELVALLNKLPPEAVLPILAVGTGALTGSSVVIFNYLIRFVHWATIDGFMGQVFTWGPWTLALVPTLGGCVVGLIRYIFSDFGPSVSTLFAATGGDMKTVLPQGIRPVAKTVAAAVTLGTGASLGPEGPSVEIGANCGLLWSRLFQVSQDRQRILLGAGAAAGIAAGFNAPIAGVFFALEVVWGSAFETSAVSVVLLSAVVSSLIAQVGLGEAPAFHPPPYELANLGVELPLYMGLGFFATLVSALATEMIKFSRAAFGGEVPLLSVLGRIPRHVQPVIGGALVGTAALIYPQIMFNGYQTVQAILSNASDLSNPNLLLQLLIVKMVFTAVSLGSGLVGGVFAPSILMGASLGAAYDKYLQAFIGVSSIGPSQAYAMVGMAAMLAGVASCPLTSIILLFELTRSYEIVLPLMAAVGLGAAIKSRPILREFTTLSAEDMDLEIVDVIEPEAMANDSELLLEDMLVSEAMSTPPPILTCTMPLLDASSVLTDSRSYAGIVKEKDGSVRGIVNLQDFIRAAYVSTEPLEDMLVQDICSVQIDVAYPDEKLSDVVRRMDVRDSNILPVLSRANSNRIVGVVTRDNIRLASSVTSCRQTLDPIIKKAAARPRRPSKKVPVQVIDVASDRQAEDQQP